MAVRIGLSSGALSGRALTARRVSEAAPIGVAPVHKPIERHYRTVNCRNNSLVGILSRDSWHGQRIGDALAVEIDDGVMDG